MAVIDDMIESASKAARRPYFAAIAAQIAGDDPGPHWAAFRRVVGRAYLLGLLLGRAEAAAATRAVGHVYEEPPTLRGLMGRQEFDRFGIETSSDLFVNRDFARAIRALAARVPRLRSEIDALRAEAVRLAEAITVTEERDALRSLLDRLQTVRDLFGGSFWVSDVNIEGVREARRLIARWLTAEGAGARGSKSIAEFVDEAQAGGLSGLTRARLETVMRTNLSSASNEAAVRTFREPRVRAEFPLFQIDEIRDRRTRGNPSGLYPDGGVHWQMDGYVGTLQDIERQGLRPPNGYNCRAGLRPIGIEEAAAMGLLRSSGAVDPAAVRRFNGDRQRYIDAGLYPDPGFKIPAIRA